MIYIDTCIISGLVRNDIQPNELNSLNILLKSFEFGLINLTTSEITRLELDKIPEQYKEPHIELYKNFENIPLVKTFSHISRMTLLGVGGGTRIDPLYLSLQNILPDENDILHLFQAAKNGATTFLTVDARTILKYKDEIKNICGLQTMTPNDYHTKYLNDKKQLD